MVVVISSFLWLICLGALLQSIYLYFDAGSIEEIMDITWKRLDKLCITQLWCLYIGMLTVLVALICKLWRAERVCQFRRGQTILVRHVIWPFAVLVVVELALLTVATTVYPPFWQEVLMDPFDDTINITDNNSTANLMAILGIMGNDDDNNGGGTIEPGALDEENLEMLDELMMPTCFYRPVPAMTALRAVSHVLIVSAQLLVLWMGYQTRNISDDLVDTDLVFYMILSWLILYIPYLLLEFGIIPSGNAYHYLALIFPFLFAMLAPGFLIAPKAYFVFYEKRHGKYPERRARRLLSWTSNRTSIVASTGRTRVSGVTRAGDATAAAAEAVATAYGSPTPPEKKRKKAKAKPNPQPEAPLFAESSHEESTTKRESVFDDSEHKDALTDVHRN